MEIFVVQASPDDVTRILELQKLAYQSEAEIKLRAATPP